jgi:hypothetical protein
MKATIDLRFTSPGAAVAGPIGAVVGGVVGTVAGIVAEPLNTRPGKKQALIFDWFLKSKNIRKNSPQSRGTDLID